ncbi:hypothetical protein XELAEV_18001662mg [Xenopus laevis]|uniref:Uncharacterized protein n=1 Tax=Xenopus laevis TaxID=8355 RepID=A0A974BP31_XENLA|nr:hypothetical protein XELAEV_18001662mg [Xenopus laevis]
MLFRAERSKQHLYCGREGLTLSLLSVYQGAQKNSVYIHSCYRKHKDTNTQNPLHNSMRIALHSPTPPSSQP